MNPVVAKALKTVGGWVAKKLLARVVSRIQARRAARRAAAKKS